MFSYDRQNNYTKIYFDSAIVGILDVLMIGNSFGINTVPPLNATNEQLILFAKQYYQEVLKGAWLQAVGTFFIILFAIAIVDLTVVTNTFSVWLTILD